MPNNFIYSIQDTTVAAITEPVTAAELKDYIRLEGFTDAGGSEVAFSDDDTLINLIIKSAREQFEKVCGLTLTPTREKVCVLNNSAGNIELPYGPVKTVDEVLDEDDNDLTADIETVGLQWVQLISPVADRLKVTYTCGYGSTGIETLPGSLKLDILRAAAYLYVNRGDDATAQKFISQLAYKHSRLVWLD